MAAQAHRIAPKVHVRKDGLEWCVRAGDTQFWGFSGWDDAYRFAALIAYPFGLRP